MNGNLQAYWAKVVGTCLGIAIVCTVWFFIAKNKKNVTQMKAAIEVCIVGILTYLYGLVFLAIALVGFGVYKLADYYYFKPANQPPKVMGTSEHAPTTGEEPQDKSSVSKANKLPVLFALLGGIVLGVLLIVVLYPSLRSFGVIF